ncbi:MAG: hypothetical protein QOD11_1840 [Bradyrhizobium sp.]|jgi:hypothetical protein|nr:hypothetical protein [Bradyrhizobium sp.]
MLVERKGRQVQRPARPVKALAKAANCVCVFIGTKDAYQNYRAILAQPLSKADDVAPDYKT